MTGWVIGSCVHSGGGSNEGNKVPTRVGHWPVIEHVGAV